MRGKFHLVGLFAILAVILVGFFSTASAERFTGGSYIIDASVVGNSFGGDTTGGSYKLTSSGGESIIGQGSGGSYKLNSGYVAQLQNSLQLTVQPANLRGYYPLDEESGTRVNDLSDSAINGTLNGTPTFGAGKIGGAVTLNGTTDYALVGTSADFTYTEFTLQAWVKSSVTNQTMAAVSKANNYWLGISFNKAAIYDWTGGSTCQSTTNVANNAWHHIAATLKSGVTNGSVVYIDGVQSHTCTWTPFLQNGQPAIGASKAVSWQQFFNGSIDNVKIFDRAFSANEIKAEYDAGVAGNTAGLGFASDIVPGVSQTSNYDAAVLTDSVKGYTLAVNQNNDLTKGADTISGVSGTIASPVTWVEGTTKGLGFTLYGTNATSIPGKWSSGAAYAAFPGTSTSYYTRTGRQSAKDVLNMRLRLDTTMLNPAGTYTNVITTVGTVTP